MTFLKWLGRVITKWLWTLSFIPAALSFISAFFPLQDVPPEIRSIIQTGGNYQATVAVFAAATLFSAFLVYKDDMQTAPEDGKTSKQKEFSDLEKNVRELQREEIDAHRALRQLDKEHFTKQMDTLQEALRVAQEEIKSTELTLDQLRKRNQLVDMGARVVQKISKVDLDMIKQNREAAFDQIVQTLDTLTYPDTAAIHAQFRAGMSSDAPPDDSVLRTAYWLGAQQASISELRASLETAASLIPFLIAEFDRNPNQPVRKIFYSWTDIRNFEAAEERAKSAALRAEADQLERLGEKADAIIAIARELYGQQPRSQNAQALLSEADRLLSEARAIEEQISNIQEARDLLTATLNVLERARRMHTEAL